jgi:hypothetical protein
MPLRGPNPLSPGHRTWLRGSIIPFRSRIIYGNSYGNSSPQRHKGTQRDHCLCPLCFYGEPLGAPVLSGNPLARLEGLVGAFRFRGVVAEWLNAAVLKTAERETVP